MSTLSEKLLESMELISNAAIDRTSKDLTVECLIESIVDSKNGIYNVKYLSNTLSVTASNPSLKYNIDDKVYVLIPEGNMNNPKFIIGLVSSQKGESHVDENYQTDYIQITDNLFTSLSEGIELCSYKTETIDLNNPLDPNIFPSNFTDIISNYLNNYNAFALSMFVKTSLPLEQQKAMGDYGLQFMLPFIRNEEDGTQTSLDIYYSINTDNIFGNPYNLSEGVKQTIYFDVDENLIYDINRKPRIVCYIKDFIQSEEEKPYDVVLSNFSLNIVQKIPEENKTGYYLYLTASEGPFFLNNSSKKTKIITPHLLLNNEEVTFEGADCYWFEEDVNVIPSSSDYTKLGGIGWKCLNQSDGSNYVTNIYTQEVTASDIMVAKRYKCLLQYNNTNIKGEIVFRNFETKATVNLYLKNGSTFPKGSLVDLVCEVNFTDEENKYLYDYAWARYDEKGKYLDNNFYQVINQKGLYNSSNVRIGDMIEILFDTNKMNDSLNTIYCSAFIIDSGKKKLIETKSLNIKLEDKQFRLVIENDNIAYNYDADGDSPLSSAEYYDRPISSKIKAITPLSFRIYKDTGIELNELEYRQCSVSWYVPKKSMFELSDDIIKDAEINDDYYIVSGQGRVELDYLIARRFNYDVLHSNILLKVVFGDLSFEQSATIRFVKDGMSGTNGTKFTASLFYNNYLYGEKNAAGVPQKMHLLYSAEDKKWYLHDLISNTLVEALTASGRNIYFNNSSKDSNISLRIYKDGEEYTDANSITIHWSVVDKKEKYTCLDISKDDNDNYYLSTTIEEWVDNTVYTNIIQAEVIISEKVGNQNYQTTLYVRYPVEITRIEKAVPADLSNIVIPIVNGGYSEVTYATDGTNPKYNNNKIFTCEDSYNDELKDSYTYKWTFSRNFIKKKNKKKILTQKITDPTTGKEIEKAILDENENIQYIETIPAPYECDIVPLEKFNDDIRNNYIKVEITGDTILGNIIHIKPINCLFNQYGMSNINGWDGSKLEIDENGQYILAPQMGAGEKNDDNTFTGLVMGKSVNGEETRNGLFGYYHGQQSIFLNAETGGATFGVAGAGQIIIEPNSEGEVDENGNLKYRATLRSGNFIPKDETHEGSGMEIDLATPSIRFGSGNFYVTEDGAMNASGKGTIAGWSIEEDRLTSIKDKNKITIQAGTNYDSMGNTIEACIYSNSHDKLEETSKGFYLGGNGISIGKSLKAECEYDEQNNLTSVMYIGDVTNAESRWEINGYGQTTTDKDGKIISPHSYIKYGTIDIENGTNGVYLGTNGIRLGNKFRVMPDGVVEVGNLNSERWIMSSNEKGAYISYSYDKTTAATSFNGGSIPQGFTFDDINANVFLGTKGISLGIDKFFVTNNGELYAVKGFIGGWKLFENELSNNNIYLRGGTGDLFCYNNADKPEDGYAWKIDGSGYALFNNINATGGKIAGWEIQGNNLVCQSADGEFLSLNADTSSISGKNWELASWGGRIAGWEIMDGYLSSVDETGHGIALDAKNSAIIGDNWMIDNNSGYLGDFYFNADGSIGGINWAIDHAGNGNFGSLFFYADGSIMGNKWSIDANGVANFEEVYALNLGNYTIDENGIHGGNFQLQGWIAEPKAFKSSSNKNIYINTDGGFKLGTDDNFLELRKGFAKMKVGSGISIGVSDSSDAGSAITIMEKQLSLYSQGPLNLTSRGTGDIKVNAGDKIVYILGGDVQLGTKSGGIMASEIIEKMNNILSYSSIVNQLKRDGYIK